MIPFYVDAISCQNYEKPCLDGSYIYLNCKSINFDLGTGDIVKGSKTGHALFIEKIDRIVNDEIFSHWKLHCRIISNNPKIDYIEPFELKSGQYFYKAENPNE